MAEQEKPKRKRSPAKKPNKRSVKSLTGRQASSAGRRKPVVDQTGWRRQLVAKSIKFDDRSKEVYLKELSEHGLRMRSAAAAGVSCQCVLNHIENDPVFAEAVDEALQVYRDRVVDHSTTLALEGIERRRFDKDGNVTEEWREYPIRLIELELKRVEPAYRDRQQIDLNTGGGVMVAPPGMTPEDWIAEQEAKNAERQAPIIEGEAIVIEDE